MSKVRGIRKAISSEKQSKSTQPSTAKTLVLSTASRVKTILSDVEQKLMHDIEVQNISIPLISTPLLEKDESQEERRRKQLEKIKQQKEEIRKKLLELESSEKLLQADVNLSKIRDKSESLLRPRSQFSSADTQKLKKLKNRQKQFQAQLSQKNRILEEQILKQKQQQKELLQKIRNERSKQKKKEISKRLNELAARQEERVKKLEQDKKEYMRIKFNRRIYQEYQSKWQRVQTQHEELKWKRFEQTKKQKSIDLIALRQHEKKYKQILKKQRQELSNRRIQATKVSHRIFNNKMYRNKFHIMIEEEQKNKQIIQQQKKQLMHELLERRKEFSESVKLNYAPRSKSKSEQCQISMEKPSYKKIPLEKEEAIKKGLQYLQQAKSIACKHKSPEKSLQQSKYEEYKVPKYHDYLSETKQTRDKSDGKSLRLDRNYDIDVEQARKIMKATKFSERQKIERVKLVAEKLQFEPRTIKTSSLLKKIQAKMEILEVFE